VNLLSNGIRGWRSEPVLDWRYMTRTDRLRSIMKGATSRGNAIRFAVVDCMNGGYVEVTL
jgi:hypothetical protein